jgi:Domain of unknown function (DU1801)
VREYLAALPDGRRQAMTEVHGVIRRAAPQLECSMAGAMIGYGPFHYRYASGREGDTFIVSLANQKRHVSLYLCAEVDGEYLAEANADRLGHVSVGKSCIRFTKLENLDLDVTAELVRLAAASGGAGAVDR